METTTTSHPKVVTSQSAQKISKSVDEHLYSIQLQRCQYVINEIMPVWSHNAQRMFTVLSIHLEEGRIYILTLQWRD
jgi:hypothetical protein